MLRLEYGFATIGESENRSLYYHKQKQKSGPFEHVTNRESSLVHTAEPAFN